MYSSLSFNRTILPVSNHGLFRAVINNRKESFENTLFNNSDHIQTVTIALFVKVLSVSITLDFALQV